MANILLVEDDIDLANLIIDWLTDEGHQIEHASDGNRALAMVAQTKPDLIILDIVLPMLDGLSICRKVRDINTALPILMLTGKSSIDDKEKGFDVGADDYLTKPFHLKELAARSMALLRRPPEEIPTIVTRANVTIDLSNKLVKKDNQEIHLMPKEYKILECLAKNQKKIISAELLYKSLWSSTDHINANIVRTNIKRLRSKLDTPGKPSIISTVHSFGYRLSDESAC